VSTDRTANNHKTCFRLCRWKSFLRASTDAF